MDKRSYVITRDTKKKTTVYLELDKLDGYKLNPKTTKEGSISVSKIIFINDTMTEKLIRKKTFDQEVYKYMYDKLYHKNYLIKKQNWNQDSNKNIK